MFARAVKRAWHRDLVSRPGTHAWVLSLYRAGEFHPQTVSDYFPSAAAESPSLKAAMERHCRDEQRHVKLYDRAIAALGQGLLPFEGGDVFNVVIRGETGATFETATAKSADQRRERLAPLLAPPPLPPKRSSQSLDFRPGACARAGVPGEISTLVEAVHHDEDRHTGYTLEAVRELLPPARAERVLDVHRKG